MTALWLALAGGLGSLCRYGIGIAGARLTGDRFPTGTLVVNLVGCLLIGAVMVLFEARQLDPRLRVALVGGFLGGFTTFSAFAFETVSLAERRGTSWAALYVGVSLAGGLAACLLGIALVRRLT
jgi:CrcB protein